MIQASNAVSQKEMKSYSSNRSDNALAAEEGAADNQAIESRNNKKFKLEINGE